MLNPMKISVIIPTLNEEKTLLNTLQTVLVESDIEVLVIDGGSQDNTLELAKKWGVKAFVSINSGKAIQMNYGASLATGDILLFLHGDTLLPRSYGNIIREKMQNQSVIAGAFQLSINSQSQTLRLIEKIVNWRSHWLSLPYGDQGLFIKASTFRKIGGFKPIPIMEDFELIQRLKKLGKIAIASQSVVTSDRRWRKLGIVKTTLINQLIVLGYYSGISPQILAQWYRGKNGK